MNHCRPLPLRLCFRATGAHAEESGAISARLLDGQTVTLPLTDRLRFDDGDALVEAALLGTGVLQAPDYMVDEAIAAGRLVEMLPGHRPLPMPIQAVPANRLMPARGRALLDALTGAQPSRAQRKPM